MFVSCAGSNWGEEWMVLKIDKYEYGIFWTECYVVFKLCMIMKRFWRLVMSYGSFVSSACNLRRNWLECVGRVKTVKPVLSGHPWEMAYWRLNTGWPFNTGLKNVRAIEEYKDGDRAKYPSHNTTTLSATSKDFTYTRTPRGRWMELTKPDRSTCLN